MEKETELYLVKRIKELENENAYLKGKVKGYEDRDEIDDEIIRERYESDCDKDTLGKALDNHFLAEFEGYDVSKLVAKAKAFDKIQEILNLAVCYWVEEKKYELYTTKPYIKKQIEIEIDKETFKQLWEAFKKWW